MTKNIHSGFDLSAEDYKILYRRFLDRSPRHLFEAAFMRRGDLVLDLCAGSMGRASIQALKMGAKSVAAVDLDPHVKELKKVDSRIVPYNYSVNDFLTMQSSSAFDQRFPFFNMAICQQGINYWFSKANIRMLSRVLRKYGVFVFNTFNEMPDKRVTHREYVIGRRSYMEVYQLVGDVVHHAQFVDGLAPHYTTFDWIPRKAFEETLRAYFDNVVVTPDGATDIYRCIK